MFNLKGRCISAFIERLWATNCGNYLEEQKTVLCLNLSHPRPLPTMGHPSCPWVVETEISSMLINTETQTCPGCREWDCGMLTGRDSYITSPTFCPAIIEEEWEERGQETDVIDDYQEIAFSVHCKTTIYVNSHGYKSLHKICETSGQTKYKYERKNKWMQSPTLATDSPWERVSQFALIV